MEKEIINKNPAGLSLADWAFHSSNPDQLPKKARELLLLVEKEARLNGSGWAYGKIAYFAFELGLSIRYTQKLFQKLRNADLIEVKRREKNFYRVNHFFSTI